MLPRIWPNNLELEHIGQKLKVHVKDGSTYEGTLNEVEFDKLILIHATRNSMPCSGMVSLLFENIDYIPEVNVKKEVNGGQNSETSENLRKGWVQHTSKPNLPSSVVPKPDNLPSSAPTKPSKLKQNKPTEIEAAADKVVQKTGKEFIHPPWLSNEFENSHNSILDIGKSEKSSYHKPERRFNSFNVLRCDRVKNWVSDAPKRNNGNYSAPENGNIDAKESYGKNYNGNGPPKDMSTSNKIAAAMRRTELPDAASLSGYDSDVMESCGIATEGLVTQGAFGGYDSDETATPNEQACWQDCNVLNENTQQQSPEDNKETMYQYSNRNTSNLSQPQQVNNYNQQVNSRNFPINKNSRNIAFKPAQPQNKSSLLTKPIVSKLANSNNKSLPKLPGIQRVYSENKPMQSSTGAISKTITFHLGNRQMSRQTPPLENGVSSLTSKSNRQYAQNSFIRGGPHISKYKHQSTLNRAQNVAGNNTDDDAINTEHSHIIFKTFNGCVIPSVSVDLREKIRLTAARTGLVAKETNAFLARGICDLAISLLKHVCHVSDEENFDTNVDVVIICEGAIEVGLMTGLLLNGHSFTVCLYKHDELSSGFDVNSSIKRQSSIEYFKRTGNRVVDSVNKLLTPNLIILCTSVVSDVILPDEVINWIYNTQRDVLVVDPPPCFQLDRLNAQKFAALPILPVVGIEESYSQLYLINLFIPYDFFAEEGVEFENPFGMKNILRLYPKTI
ncbi:uncharacterized protein LOC119689639 [Teleopsis dalmanni]|uniref:uncharacterized protein LOC119689639 n=1 Tax=Teleopsis dalmanni TaxID=139649 RepID=UPI000D32B506|nr:uncharacterized protein LOC119689639 [Teleopsis dalmanni]